MDTTRRLSLALLLVAPLVAAQDLYYGSLEVLHPETTFSHESSASQESLNPENPIYEPVDHFNDEDQEGHFEHEDVGNAYSGEHQEESHEESRRRRAIQTPEETLETAEQAFFRPHFRYQNVIHDRYKRKNDFKRENSFATPINTKSSSHGKPHSDEKYVFRGTPFGAVFVHRSTPHHTVYPLPYYHRQH